MDQFEPPILPLSAKRDLINDKRRRQVWQMALQGLNPYRQVVFWHATRQRQMESELLKDVRVPPLRQQSLLSCAETRLATPRKLSLGRGFAEPIKTSHRSLGNSLQTVSRPKRRKRQKSAQLGQFQPITDSRCDPARKITHSLFKSLNCAPVFQFEWWLQRAMKPILARSARNVVQARHIELLHLTTRYNIPAQPGRAEVSQRTVRRHVVNCEASV